MRNEEISVEIKTSRRNLFHQQQRMKQNETSQGFDTHCVRLGDSLIPENVK